MTDVLEKQVNELEKEMNKYMIPLPPRPPKSVQVKADTVLLEDNFIFKQVFTGIQTFLDMHSRSIRSVVHNDPIRALFTKFAIEEMEIFDGLAKYGKLKGWILPPPLMFQ